MKRRPVYYIDGVAADRRGARGILSNYALHKTTCCENWCALDVDVDDLYFDGTDLLKVLSLLRSTTEPEILCPFCGTRDWQIDPVDDLEDIPEAWAWGLKSPEEDRKLGAKPK
jgi:hypothetical protein